MDEHTQNHLDFEKKYQEMKKEKRKAFWVAFIIGFHWWCVMFMKFLNILWRIVKGIAKAVINISESMYNQSNEKNEYDKRWTKKNTKKSNKKNDRNRKQNANHSR